MNETPEQIEFKKQKLDEFFQQRPDLLRAWLTAGKDPNMLPVYFHESDQVWKYINRKTRRQMGIRA